ncbi:type II toxin-antitoxin system RelE/ParE family toxin [Mesorhizobium sp. CN2-181]|uniref:type II toxin-antitoxin system RelE/ParE family toxin n=1 Tax=Mesorhizobium yinganensis TaxID=3157707 RepID=UPI0032B7BDDA
MKVIFTPLAERQIGDLHNYIETRASTAIADGFAGRIVDFCMRLTHFPKRGTARDDILPGLRTIGMDRRVTIAFMVLPEQVLIEGIFYGGQDFESRLRDRQ